MMRFGIVAAMVILAAGCGQTAESPVSGQHSPSKARPVAKAPAPEPKPKPVIEFADVDEAIAALTQGALKSDSDKLMAAENWLVAHVDQAAEPVATIFVDEQADVAPRIAACRVLRRWNSGASKESLLAGLGASSEQIRLNAIKGLGLIEPSDDEIIAALLPLLESDVDHIRLETLKAFGNIGPLANDAVADKLVAILNDTSENETLRDMAKRALNEIDPRHTLLD